VRDREKSEPDFRYGPLEKEMEPMLVESIGDVSNGEGWANAVVVTSEDPKQKKLKGVAQNNNPGSPSSFQNRGFWKVKLVKYRTLADQETADRLALAQLRAASSYNRVVSISIMPDLALGPKQSIELYHKFEGQVVLDGVFPVTNFSVDMLNMPKMFSIEAARSEAA
jgi:hypothetical protein